LLLAVGLCMVSPIQRVRCAAVVAEVGSGSGSSSDFSGSGHASGSNDDDDGDDDGDDGDEAQVVETTTPKFGPIKNGTQSNLTNATMPAATSTATADTGGVAGSDDDDDDDLAIGLGVGIPVGIVVLAGVAFLLHTQQSQDTNGGARSGSSYEAVPASVHARPNMPLTKPAPPYSSTTELDLSTRTSSYMEAHSANEAAANTGHVSYLV